MLNQPRDPKERPTKVTLQRRLQVAEQKVQILNLLRAHRLSKGVVDVSDLDERLRVANILVARLSVEVDNASLQ